MDYGAFVELAGTGGTQALLHISELDTGRVRVCRDTDSRELSSLRPHRSWHFVTWLCAVHQECCSSCRHLDGHLLIVYNNIYKSIYSL